MASPAHRPRGAIRIALGASLLVCGGLLLVRATGPWPGDAIVWPAAAAAFGALLIWRTPNVTPRRLRGWAAHTAREPSPLREPAARARISARPGVSRRGLGVTLVLGGGLAYLWASGEVRPAGEDVLAAVTVLIAAALIFAPSWRRLASSLAAERDERVRSQERAAVGAHLHDSVLQTLALIQRSANDPRRVATLARQQERELRAWLAGESVRPAGHELGAALQATAAEVEAAAGSSVEVVAVGECPLDERGEAVLAAAREAMLNAAKFAGHGRVSVYAELSDERIQVFVRDRGDGFDPAAVPPERRGVRESIIGRMRRAGGKAAVRASPGGGTEVEIAIERRGGGEDHR
jgi:signal transduction histidine kinase